MIEFTLGAIATTVILSLIWLTITMIYLKNKVDSFTDELKDRKHSESIFHMDIYQIMDEVENRFDKKILEFESKLSELDGKKSK
jgi:hypothetical protein